MWTETPIEKATSSALVAEFEKVPGEERYGLYTSVRKDLVEQILQNIKAVMPNHTDHGPDHVADILKKAGKLLQIDTSEKQQLSSMELYALIMGAAFHDTGNIYGRRNHQRNISKIYDFCRSPGGRDHQEKFIILKIVEAHCGKAPDGSNDTIKAMGPNAVSLFGYPVRLRWIAAILRFADELAEGKERTSLFMLKYHGYKNRSTMYHNYAKITTVDIDPGNERIALTYNIDVKISRSGDISQREENSLKGLLQYCYKRIGKLDQERQYAKHYCDLLGKYKYTSVTFNFWIGGEPINIGLPEAFTISDLVVPGEKIIPINDRDSKFKIDNIISKIRKVAKRG